MKMVRVMAFGLVAALGSTAAFAQGKMSFQTDSLHLVYYDGLWGSALGGQGVYSSQMPNGINLVADLYVGTTSSTLSFVSTATFGAVPGKWNPLSVVVPGIPGGTSVFVVTQIRDQSFAAAPVFDGAFSEGVWGYSQEFTFTLGSSITYPVMWGANGTWPAGTYLLDQYGVGSKGAILIGIIPEPGSLALLGLGSAALMIFRRSK